MGFSGLSVPSFSTVSGGEVTSPLKLEFEIMGELKGYYTPSDLKFSMSSQWTDITASGVQHTALAYTKGTNDSMSFTLFFDCSESPGSLIADALQQIHTAMLPVDMDGHVRPEGVKVEVGGSIKFAGVVEQVDVEILQATDALVPTRANVTLTLKGRYGETDPTKLFTVA